MKKICIMLTLIILCCMASSTFSMETYATDDVRRDVLTGTSKTQYIVTYNSNCSYIDNFSKTYDLAQVAEHPILERTGYDFAGWYYDSACTNPVENYSVEDQTWYAKWNPYYEYTITNGKITLNKLLHYKVVNGVAITDISVPDYIDGYPVTVIGSNAFSNSTDLTGVTLPNTVTSIKASAFDNCSNLTSVTIPDSVISVGRSAFRKCKNLSSIKLPKGITIIEESVFLQSGLTEISIPEGVTSIGRNAFYGCSNLRRVQIPASVTSIGKEAFKMCESLTGIELPIGITTIEEGTFSITGLTEIIVPNGVTSIGRYAFRSCEKLKSIQIPASVSNIADYAFSHCDAVTDVYYDGLEEQWNRIANGNLMNTNLHCLDVSVEKVTIEIRDANTNQLIPYASASARYKSTDEMVFMYNCDGSTYYNLRFPIDYIYMNVGGNYECMQYEISKPGNGKLVLFAYPRGSDYQSRVTGISLVGQSEMTVGETQNIYAAVSPATALNKAVTWSSSNNNIATVNANGKVTAKASGNVTITARTQDGGFVDSVAISIVEKNVVREIKYDNYSYKFSNYRGNFGYSDYYVIPYVRYLQLGLSPSQATVMARWWGGNCFGMSTSSMLFYKNIMREEKYNSSVHVPCDFDAPDSDFNVNEIKLREMIELMQISQCLVSGVEMRSPADVAREIDNGNPVVLGMYEEGRKNGHAVVIYGYTKSDDVYCFNIYDCSWFVNKLTYLNNNYFYFDRVSDYDWRIFEYYTYDMILDLYEKIYNRNSHNAISLLSLEEDIKYTYIICPEEDISIVNAVGQMSTVTDGNLNGQIKDIKLVADSYLAENPKYTIIAPTDTYTITGTSDEEVTTILADDYMSVEVTHKSSVPVTISADLHEIKIENSEVSNYRIKYTTYDNAFDEMTISGIASGPVNVILEDTNVVVSGADNISAIATVSGVETTAVANDVNNGNAVVDCTVVDDIANLQILIDDIAVTEAMQLAERQQLLTPEYSVASGEYTEGQTLTFTKDEDTLIYYTTDESIPTKDNGILYTLPIEINQSMTIKAIATKYGYADSEILELNYVLPNVVPPFSSLATGEYDTIQVVELKHQDGVEIYYTTDGTEPTENGVLYNTPITIFEDTTIRTYALTNGIASDVVEYEYQINHQYPIYINDGIVNQDGELIDNTNLTELSQITLVANKTKTEELVATFIASFYDEQGKMLKTYANANTLIESENVINISVEAVPGAVTLRVFVWDELKTATPLCEAKDIGV